MSLLRVLVIWILGVATLGCRPSPSAGATPSGQTPAEVDRPPRGKVCTQVCTRFDACLPRLEAEPESDVAALQREFVFDCSPACKTATEPSSPDTAKMLDCVDLDDCHAFLSCLGAAPEARLSADEEATEYSYSAPAPTDACESICHRHRECDRERNDAGACLVLCQGEGSESERAAVLQCGRHPTCDALSPCLASASTQTTELADEPTRFGVEPLCQSLCDRTLLCGAGDAELTPAQLRELSAATADAWMECALQCGQELREDNSKRFETCLAKEACEDFLKCAEEL